MGIESGLGLPPIIAHLYADAGNFKATLAEADAQTVAFTDAAGGSFSKLAGIGKAALIGLAAAAVGVTAVTVPMAEKFDAAMELIHTQAGYSQAQVDSLSGSVLALAGSVGIGPQTLADGLYHIASAGVPASQAMDLLTAAAKESRIGNADLETTTQGLIGMMAAHIKGIKSATDATAYMNAIVGTGDMRMQDLAHSIQSGILPVMANAGLSITDFGAAMATLTDNVTSPDVAATHLRMTISLLEAPTLKAKGALHAMGLGTFSLADDLRKPNGLLVAFQDLKKHLSNMSPDQANASISAIFGGGKSSATAQELLREMDRLQSKYPALAQGVKTYGESWAATQKTFKQQVDQLKATLESYGVQIGNFLIPKLMDLAHWTNEVIGWFQRHKAVAEAVGIAITSVLLVAIGAYTVAMASAAIATISATWPILAIIAAVAAVGVGIWYLWTHWHEVWGWIEKEAEVAWQWIQHNAVLIASALLLPVGGMLYLWEHWQAIWTWIKDAAYDAWMWIDHTAQGIWRSVTGWLGQMVNDIAGLWSGLVGGVEGAWTAIGDAISGALSWIWQIIVGAWNGVINWLGSLWDSMVTIGYNLIIGMADGVVGAAKALWDSVVNVVSGVVNGVKSFLGIHSASTVFAEIGANSALGYMGGWADTLSGFNAGAAVTGNITAGIPNGVAGAYAGIGGSAASGLVTVPIELTLDGRNVLFQTVQQVALTSQATTGSTTLARSGRPL